MQTVCSECHKETINNIEPLSDRKGIHLESANRRFEQKDYPILEFDPELTSVINPKEETKDSLKVPEHCVLSFFNDVLKDMNEKGSIIVIGHLRSETGSFPIYETKFGGKKIAVFHPGVGAPLAAAFLEELISLGASKFIVCGGAGVLDRQISAGQLLIPVSAVRDEGTSYHYLPPGREVEASPLGLRALENVLTRHNIKYLLTKTWTTDAFYRETKEKVKLRRSWGCLTVEMEASALFAVAQFRNVTLAQVLYAGDDVSGDEWDTRMWMGRRFVREDLLRISIEACAEL